MDEETVETLGLPYDEKKEEAEEIPEETELDAETINNLGGLSVVPETIRKEYEEAKKSYDLSFKNTLNQIQKARDLLLSQPTELSRREYLQKLGSSLTQTRKPTDPRFYERRNLYTFLRDVGEFGSSQKEAERKAKFEQQQKLLELDELAAKYDQDRDYKRLQLASELIGKYKPAAVKEDEITRLQNSRDQLLQQRKALDPRDPNYLNLSKRIQELDKRIGYLGGERAEKDGAELSVGEKALDKKIGEEYANWVVGGGAVQSASRISRINDVVSKLGKKDDISGAVVGFTLENLPTIASAIYPDAQDAKDVVESVVQTDLRAILGGQFAQKEGEALIKRAYNPRLSEEKNARRLKLLSLQMQMVSDEKNRAMTYFGEKGTIKGYTFRPFTANDFLTEDQLERLDRGESPEQILGLSKPETRPASGGKPSGSSGKPDVSGRKPAVDPVEEARKELARRREAQQGKGG
jgi:hypothetical protein